MPIDHEIGRRLAENMIALYSGLEERLAGAIALEVSKRPDPNDLEKLDAIRRMRENSQRLLDRIDSDTRGEALAAITEAFVDGSRTAFNDVVAAGVERRGSWLERQGLIGRLLARLLGITKRRDADRRTRITRELADIRDKLPGVDAIQALANELSNRMSSTHMQILRWQDDAYRHVVADRSVDVLAGTSTRLRASQVIWEQLLGQGVTGFVDKAGRNWQLTSYVEMATRSTVAQATIEAHLARLKDLDVDLVQVSNAPQECSRCRDFEGRVLSASGPAGRRTVEHALTDEPMTVDVVDTVAGAIKQGLFHPNCFPGDVLVSAPSGVEAADARWYEGPLVVIHTASGDELSVTPNHPILTSEGWVPAGQLNEGNHVLRYRANVEASTLSVPDDEQVPTRISEVFDALRESSKMPAVRVPAATEQFHGDGLGSDVDVVLTDGFLRDAAGQALGDSKLLGGGSASVDLLAEGATLKVVQGAGLSANSIMGSTDLSGPLLCRHGLPLAPLGSASISSVPTPQQSVADGDLASLDSLGDLGLGNAFEVHLDGRVDPIDAALLGDTSGAQLPVEGSGVEVHGGRDLARALSGLVTGDRVIEVELRRDWSGHVYNLQSGDGWYVANGLVVSNCRHRLAAYLPGVTKPLVDTEDPQGDVARQKLRALEREVRKNKRIAAGALTDEARQAAKAEVRHYQALIRDHVANTTVMRQRHRERIGTAI